MIWAIITFQFTGYHHWVDAPEECKFLRNLHRHMFHVEVWVSQEPEIDRDVEYITFKNWLTNSLSWSTVAGKFGIEETDSCETMALKIQKFVKERYCPKRIVKVGVFEDAENGAFVE